MNSDADERRNSKGPPAFLAGEERLRRILNLDGVGVLVFELAGGTLLDANDAFLAMFGYSREEIAARALTWRTLTPPEYVALSEEKLRVLQRAGRIGPYEKEYWRKDGSRAWMMLVGACPGDGTFVEYCFDVGDRRRAEEALREREAWLGGQREALEAALNGAPLETSLGVLVRTATDGLGPGTRAAFYLANGEGTSLHHVVGMPAAYAEAVDGFKIGPESLACGLATHTGQPVLTPDVTKDPRWEPWRWLAERFEYRGCWSFPIHTSAGKFVGTFAVYSRQPREATQRDLELASLLTQTAAIIIAQYKESESRKRAEAALRESEEWFRLMVQSVHDHAIFLMNPDGRVASWNEGAQRLLGYTAEEALGQPSSLFFTEEDRRAGLPERELKTTAQAGRATDENWLVCKRGVRFWASGTTTALRDDAGTLRGFAKIFRDLTERREAEQRVRLSEERLRLALAAARMGTWSWEVAADRHLRDANLNQLLGLEPVETVLPIEEFFSHVHPEDRDRVREAFDSSVRQGHNLRVEFRVVWPDGEVRWLQDQGDVFGGAADCHLAGACLDITERKLMEEALREADRRKDEFLAMLGHELRNPLAPLRGVMETLQRQKLDGPALERAYAMMERQVGHLTRLVDDLLDVSRITRGLVELHREPVNLAEVANQAVEIAAPAIEGRGHDLSVTLPRKPLRVGGDAARLTQVVFNLLNNAAKYTDPGGRIWLSVEREGDRAVVRVRDNGSGMKAELVPRVFDLFTQGERSPDRSQGGLGLGLTLAKRLVEMHAGTVEARSEGAGKGSEFTVRLPALPPEAEKPPPARAPGPPQEEVQVGRALVVDDNSDVAVSVTWILGGLAREVKMAHSGQAALDLVGQWRPDIILCDMGMPGMDGYETCRRLRQLPGMEKVVIAAVSGYGGEEDRRKSRQSGFNRHLVKPIGRATLEELVRSAAGA